MQNTKLGSSDQTVSASTEPLLVKLVMFFCFIFKHADYKDMLETGWTNSSSLLNHRKKSGFRYNHSSPMAQI